MVTSVAPIIEQQRPRAQARAGGQDAHVRFDFGACLDSSTSITQLANETLDQSHIAARNRAGEYCCNQQYSVTAITTSTGAIAERYAYSAYGQPTILDASGSILSTSSISNRYTYTGREWDATLGLHHFRARWMSPSAGRFLGRDPIGFAGGNNFYVYWNSLRDADPSGLSSLKLCNTGKMELNFPSALGKMGAIGDLLLKFNRLRENKWLKGALPCDLSLDGSVEYEYSTCKSCCKGVPAESGYWSFSGQAGVGVSCTSNGGVGLYVEVSGSIKVAVTMSREWDTCEPYDRSKACLTLEGETAISFCSGIAAIGTRACIHLKLECSGGYCVPGPITTGGWNGGCKIRAWGDVCAFFQCVGGTFPPVIEFP